MKKLILALWAMSSLVLANAQDEIYSINNWGAGGITQIGGVDPDNGAASGPVLNYASTDQSTVGAALAYAANGYLYYISSSSGNEGTFTVSAIPAYPSSTPTAPDTGMEVLSGDANGTVDTANVFFRRMASGPGNWVYILATEEGTNNVYLLRFQTGAGGTATNLESLGTITLEGQAPATNFNNGDIALDGSGNLYALVNLDQPGGQAVIYYAAKSAISNSSNGVTDMVKKQDVVDQDGQNFVGPVVGLALSSTGNFYIAVQDGSDGGIYFMSKVSATDPTITITGPISSGNAANIADLATVYLPINTVLPVRYGSIKAAISAGMLEVNWSTMSETNNQKFDVEVSADGVHFAKAGTVFSKADGGNSDKALYYSFSTPVTRAMAMAGISAIVLALIALGLRPKRRWPAMLVLLLGMGTALASCDKSGEAVLTNPESKIFVRLKQYDTDGGISVSEVITAYQTGN
ncbi:hypothetical protein GCM10027051_02650 [Niabella terrae]